jgi:vacuolar-type H+-ATPase subunit H
MEKVWGELKKIEAEAEQIRTEAQDKAKKITEVAQQESSQLIANAKIYADEEAKQIYDCTVQDANQNHDEQLKTAQADSAKLKTKAENRMDKATTVVMNAVLEE